MALKVGTYLSHHETALGQEVERQAVLRCSHWPPALCYGPTRNYGRGTPTYLVVATLD